VERQDLRKPPASVLDLISSSGHLSKLIAGLETTKEIRMLDSSGETSDHLQELLEPDLVATYSCRTNAV
jgi:hypothetical protein